MIVRSTDIQNSFGKYLEIASEQEIVITKNELPIARLVGMRESISFLTDRLVGIIPPDVDEKRIKTERLTKQ